MDKAMSKFAIESKDLKVGESITKFGNERDIYIITDVLGDGKFKAVQKDSMPEIIKTESGRYVVQAKDETSNIYHNTKISAERELKKLINERSQEFDISTKTTTQQTIKLTPEIKAKIKGEAPKIKTSGKMLEEKAVAPVEPTKVSKVAKSIKAKAEEKGIEAQFKGLAEYSPVVIKEQVKLIEKLMEENIDKAKRMATGKEVLDKDIKGAMLIKMMEDYAMENKDGELILELANSPLVSATSEAGQTLRLIRERFQDSATMKINEVKKIRENVAKKKRRGKTKQETKKNMKNSLEAKIDSSKTSKYSWEQLIEDMIC